MLIETTPIKDLLILKPKVLGDARGFFMESFNQNTFDEVLTQQGQKPVTFVQDNHSRSAKGVLRGLHYQMGAAAQGKLVRVTAGRVWDVAVDLRKSSPTFGKWHGLALSEENQAQLWIPAGFAHGFLVLSETADFLYKATQYYSPKDEQCIVWNDGTLNITWPTHELIEARPLVSGKDADGVSFLAGKHYS